MYLHAFLLSVEWIIKNNETFISKQEYFDAYKSSTHCRRDMLTDCLKLCFEIHFLMVFAGTGFHQVCT